MSGHSLSEPVFQLLAVAMATSFKNDIDMSRCSSGPLSASLDTTAFDAICITTNKMSAQRSLWPSPVQFGPWPSSSENTRRHTPMSLHGFELLYRFGRSVFIDSSQSCMARCHRNRKRWSWIDVMAGWERKFKRVCLCLLDRFRKNKKSLCTSICNFVVRFQFTVIGQILFMNVLSRNRSWNISCSVLTQCPAVSLLPLYLRMSLRLLNTVCSRAPFVWSAFF